MTHSAPSDDLIDLFLAWAERIPHAPAVIDGGELLSYRALEVASRRAAADFIAAGWRPGDVVGAAFGAMRFADAVVAILALARAGIGQLSLSNHEAASDEAAALLARFGAVGLLAASPPAAAPGVAVRLIDPAWRAADGPMPPAFNGPALRDLCFAIGRSSGTTGVPKAFAITHAQEAFRMSQHVPPTQILPEDRVAILSGLGFLTGISYSLRALCGGATLVVLKANPDPATMLRLIDHYGVSFIYASPVHVRGLLGSPTSGEGAEAPRLPRLRVLRVSGSALSPALLAEARARLTPAVNVAYGINEVGVVTGASPEILVRHPNVAGLLGPGIQGELRNAAGQPVPPGQPGKLWLRSAGMVAGYLQSTEAEAARFQDGWFDTGDVAEINAEGLVFLRGRADELMNFDGILVAPRDIEAAFEDHPLVAEVVAFAMPSQVRQDVPCIAVVARGPKETDVLLAHGRQKLGLKAPRMVLWLNEMPRNSAGKELRRELAARAGQARRH